MPTLSRTEETRLQVLHEIRLRPSLRRPGISRFERGDLITRIAERCGCSEKTVRRVLADDRPATERGKRTGRADAGRMRVLPEPLRGQVEARVRELLSQTRLLFAAPRGKTPRTTISDAEVCRQLYHEFPALEELLPRELETGDRLPYNRSLYHAVNRFTAAIREADRPRRGASVRIEAPHINYQWVKDETVTDFFLQPGPGESTPQRAWLSVVEDEFSRAIVFAHHVRNAHRASYSDLMIRAIGRKPTDAGWPMCGVPQQLRYDVNFVDFSAHAKRCMADLGIQPNPCQGMQPQSKGKVERIIGTIKRGLHPLLPGYCGAANTGDEAITPGADFICRSEERGHRGKNGDTIPSSPTSRNGDGVPVFPDGMVSPFSADSGLWYDPRSNLPLLTLEEADAALHAWIAEYHRTVHGSLGCSPRTAWANSASANVGLVRVPTDQQLFETFLIQADDTGHGPGGRVVAAQQVRAHGLTFQAEWLGDYEGMVLDVRYKPTDPSRVWVFERGRLLDEVPLLPTIVLGEGIDWSDAERMIRDRKRADKAARADRRAAQAGLHLHAPLAARLAGKNGDTIPSSPTSRNGDGVPVLPAPDAVPWQPPSSADDEKLAQVTIGGIPLRRAAGG